jgi:hypothetical protein
MIIYFQNKYATYDEFHRRTDQLPFIFTVKTFEEAKTFTNDVLQALQVYEWLIMNNIIIF